MNIGWLTEIAGNAMPVHSSVCTKQTPYYGSYNHTSSWRWERGRGGEGERERGREGERERER